MKLENFDDIDGIVTSIMNSSTTEFEFSTSYIPFELRHSTTFTCTLDLKTAPLLSVIMEERKFFNFEKRDKYAKYRFENCFFYESNQHNDRVKFTGCANFFCRILYSQEQMMYLVPDGTVVPYDLVDIIKMYDCTLIRKWNDLIVKWNK